MRSALLAVLLFLIGCDTRLSRIDSALAIEPAELAFEDTAAGDTRSKPLMLRNGSRAPLVLHLSAPAPFALELDVKLQGGESRSIDVVFTAPEPGSASATLHLSGDLELDVPLTASAVPAAICASASACRLSLRDPGTNTCVESNAADGTACSSENACLAEGQCVAGACIGAAVSCDDSNRCTVDACEPAGGCLHVAAACPESLDPCQVAACDPATGCSTVPAADGTSCGPSDCTTARVCMAGACRTLAVPDGYACGEETPCRAKGRCSAGACNQPAQTALTEAWHVTMAYQADFRGVTDAAGNLYWLACYPRASNPCELVSYSPAGLERLRVIVPGLMTLTGSRHLISAGRVVVGAANRALTAFSSTTGAIIWSHGPGAQTTLLELASDRQGRVLTLNRFEGESESWSYSSFDGATGATLAGNGLAGRSTGLVLDAQDNVYLFAGAPYTLDSPGSGTPLMGPRLVSFSPWGTLRFQVQLNEVDPPVAVFNGEVLLASGDVRSAADGSFRPSTKQWAPLSGPSPLMSATSRFRWQDDHGDANTTNLWYSLGSYLEGHTPGVVAPRFSWGSLTYSTQASEMELLADGNALLASTRMWLTDLLAGNSDVYLRSIDPAGAERFACFIGPSEVPSGRDYWNGATALTGGRWAVLQQTECFTCTHNPAPVLRVYLAPGLTAAATGWTGLRGNPGRSGGPR